MGPGHGADEGDLLPVGAAVAGEDTVLALRGPVVLDGGGAAWADGSREAILAGTGTGSAADDVLAFLDGLGARGPGEPATVRLLGFSQGGAVALAALRRAPSRFDRVVLLSGFVSTEPEEGDALLAEAPVPVLWGRGDADDVIPPDAVARTAAWLRTHADATAREYSGLGHGVSEEELVDVADFLR